MTDRRGYLSLLNLNTAENVELENSRQECFKDIFYFLKSCKPQLFSAAKVKGISKLKACGKASPIKTLFTFRVMDALRQIIVDDVTWLCSAFGRASESQRYAWLLHN
jgi:hypothetical protein